ncbi:MAG: chromosome segregation protein SMC [Vicinamibacteria bacterium]|nr:chromosome segregation protein SMC [Vicinamibacteria bacterium]
MRLEKVEIVGFKSFCDKQEVDFRGGVTGIVGPNGCGKSNISDAISWVLGEQSAKSLRGASMEDVIFNGSSSRQPLAMAEVNLKVVGLNGHSPDGSGEATVSRRLYRNGESEYLMNGATCRLRDIHELFMDTGLGAKAYSIIEQGKIGQILSTKPTDRRALIEEAAGITKYKARRRQTALKLEAAQQNLLRVNDIVNEVEKQLESLKRQASKARRYRQLREEMQGYERIVYARRFQDLTATAGSLALRLKAEAEREQAAALALGTDEAQLEARRTVLYEEENAANAVRERVSAATLEVSSLQGKSEYAKSQITDTGVRADQAREEAAGLEERVGPLLESLATRRQEAETLKQEIVAAEQGQREAEAALRERSQSQAEAERKLDGARETQTSLLTQIAALGNARESSQRNAERAEAQLLKLAGEEQETQRERERVAAARTEAEARKATAEESLAGLGREREDALSRQATLKAEAETLSREAEAAQSERDGLAGRLASLEEMVHSHQAFDEGVRALIGFQRPAEPAAGPMGATSDDSGLLRPQTPNEAAEPPVDVLGVAADFVETDAAHERVVESFLGERLQAVLVPDAENALKGVRYLKESGAGRGSFLPIANARTKAGCGPVLEIAKADPRVRGLLSDFYRVTGPHAERIRAALPEALVVDSLEDAFAVIAAHGPIACATLQGETLRGSLVEGGRDVKGLFAPRREAREVAEKLTALEAALLTRRELAKAKAEAAEGAAAEARALTERIHAAEKELVAIGRDLGGLADEEQRAARKAQVLQTERAQAEEEKQASVARVAEILEKLTVAEAAKAAGAEALAALQSALAEARAATEGAQTALAEVRQRLAALRERLTAAESDCRRLQADHEELNRRIAAARERAEQLDEKRQALQEELAETEVRLADALQARDRVSGELAVADDKVRDLRNEMEGREHALRERRREREALRDALSQIEIEKARCESDLDHVSQSCHAALGVTAAEAAQSLTEEDLARDLPGLDESIREIRDRLEKMGQVNVLAVEQAQEQEERHAFLTTQRQDLLDSIAELDRAIKEIDKASRERFQEAFEVINRHFGEMFKQLFGGGTAGLSLIDQEDILESGIDIMAQPPGKRLQSVLLLSGGEKALTAISLLFAIFQYKPSPFCILDEVDAPLDDANIGRFVRMLEGLKDDTQFIVITHSRKTMEIADQLYGVTMEEPGVSKLVSVRLNN